MNRQNNNIKSAAAQNTRARASRSPAAGIPRSARVHPAMQRRGGFVKP